MRGRKFTLFTDIKMTARLWLPALVAVVAVVVGAYGRA
jgi:hypothetical protein